MICLRSTCHRRATHLMGRKSIMHADVRTSIVTGLVLCATLIGCAAPSARTDSTQGPDTGGGAAAVGVKRIVIGIAGELPVLNLKVIRTVQSFTAPGGAEVEDLLTDGLADL